MMATPHELPEHELLPPKLPGHELSPDERSRAQLPPAQLSSHELSSQELSPYELFGRMRQQWLNHPAPLTGVDLAEDVVIELPFAPPGRPKRYVGRQEFLAFANAERAALPIRFEQCRTIAVHQTTDPGAIVVEYELAGTVLTTNRRATAAFVGVLRARDGKVVGWREYQNTLAIRAALTEGACFPGDPN